MEGWQYKSAFVLQLRPETNIEAGRFEGRVEHVASTRAMRFYSVDELLSFIAAALAEVRTTDPSQL
jgi:hypothetical protein